MDNKIWGWNQVERRILCNCACRIHFSPVCSAVQCHRWDWLEVELLFYNCFVLSRISMTGASTLFLKSTTRDEYGTRGGILNETAKYMKSPKCRKMGEKDKNCQFYNQFAQIYKITLFPSRAQSTKADWAYKLEITRGGILSEKFSGKSGERIVLKDENKILGKIRRKHR